MKNLSFVFLLIAILIAVYGLVTQNYKLNLLMIFFSGLAMLVMGLQEFQQERKVYGWLLILVFLFSLFVSIQGFFFN